LKALILAGGFATRLRPLSCTRPKILFPLVNRPLLQWTLGSLKKAGVTEAILAVSHRTENLFKHHKIQGYGIRVVYSRDPPKKPLGTGGPIKKAEKIIGHDSPFLVLNEDVFSDLDYEKILEAHEKNRGAVATLALYSVEDPSRYGVAELAKDNRIKRFIEKPKRESAPTHLINAGVYVLSPKIFRYIPEGQVISIERQVFPKLAERGELYAHVFDGLWMDIGKPEDYLEINKRMLDQLPRQDKRKCQKTAEIREPTAVDRGVSIGKGSVIGPYAVLGRHVVVGEGVQIRGSIIFPEATISDLAQIDGAIIGEGATIGKNARIRERCIVSDNANIRESVKLAKGASIGPGVTVSKSVLTSKNIC
jgi:mannose-1-phosphate guanylyltransferase